MTEENADAQSSLNLFTQLVQCKNLFGHAHATLPSNRPDNIEGIYEVMGILGEGSFGRVYRCKHIRTGEIVAIKQIDFRYDQNAVPSSLIREVSLLRELNHDNIVRLLNVLSTETYVSLVFELLDQDLGRYISRNNGVRDPWIRKPATRYYRAPEILLDSSQYSTGVDLWSVGCIFGEMVTGEPIFGTKNSFDELDAIFSPTDLSYIFADLEPQGLHLLKMLLCLDPKRRVSVEGALKHAYFNDLPDHPRSRRYRLILLLKSLPVHNHLRTKGFILKANFQDHNDPATSSNGRVPADSLENVISCTPNSLPVLYLACSK
ncbi:unnamed protein product [Lupinus luteus]|uniref:cyclin-dependent kinase n=1 Tax=Lupinus luteus TaxID=3873 RepID=A0AAV1W323_LUPLU